MSDNDEFCPTCGALEDEACCLPNGAPRANHKARRTRPMSTEIPGVFCQVTLTTVKGKGRYSVPNVCGQPAVSPYGLCRKHNADRERLMIPPPRTRPNAKRPGIGPGRSDSTDGKKASR